MTTINEQSGFTKCYIKRHPECSLRLDVSLVVLNADMLTALFDVFMGDLDEVYQMFIDPDLRYLPF